MSPAAELVARLRRLGVTIEAQDGQLKVSAPRGALTETLRLELSARKPELLALLTQPEEAELRPIARGGTLPISRFQRQLWTIEQLGGAEEANYNLVSAWRITETADPEVIAEAIHKLAERQEVLRYVFEHRNGEPLAVTVDADRIAIERADISDLDEAGQREALREASERELWTSFDLAGAPPFRWRIYLTGTDPFVLITAHHIAIDQWSFVLLRDELRRTIEAVTAGTSLPAPAFQYADFADWQLRSENGLKVADQLDWWEQKLAGAPQLTIFPPDHATSGKARGAIAQSSWGADLGDDIRAFAAREHATPYMVLLAAWAATLSLYSDQKDLVLGCALGARERPEFETMIGPFVNMLPMRLDLEDDPDMHTLLARTREAVLDAYAHHEISLEMLVQRINPPRSLEHQPIFQTGMIMHNPTEREIDPILSSGTMQNMICYARCDARDAGLAIEYRADRYDAATVNRIAQQTEAVMRALLDNPELRVSQLPTLAEADRERVLHGFNDTRLELDAAPFIAQFETRVKTQTAWAAVRCGDAELDSTALNARADTIAARLEASGVARGDKVGICMSRSTDMLAALLATQKLGAAYVPLDPDFPEARLTFMVEDSGVALVVTDTAARPTAELIDRVSLIDLDSEALPPSPPRASAARPEDTAYIIYTSGSTGRPNGVVVPHAALSNFLGSMAATPGLGAGDVLAAVTTISFDIATLELYLPLLVGATIEIVTREVATDGTALAALLERRQASVLQATPATWRLLLAGGWNGDPGFKALCGGEPLPADLAEALLARVGELWNLYGPTETTVWSTAGKVTDPGSISIGKPIANTQIYILDRNDAPVAPGIAGEIFIGGAGVTNGYLGRPRLTEERFVRDPFSGLPDARAYRTGDIGRWNENGEITHMGRRDYQVKIRGYRIELGEIERALAAHPAILQAVVAASEGSHEGSTLVAYCAIAPGAGLTSSEARDFLRDSLPPHMIPSVFVILDAIPLTPNGKVDRKALPDPYAAARLMPTTFTRPSPGLEQTIATIWEDLLPIDRAGANDNFFELGGHSLLSLRMSLLLEERTSLRIPPRMLFTQTLRQIAKALEHDHRAAEAG